MTIYISVGGFKFSLRKGNKTINKGGEDSRFVRDNRQMDHKFDTRETPGPGIEGNQVGVLDRIRTVYSLLCNIISE